MDVGGGYASRVSLMTETSTHLPEPPPERLLLHQPGLVEIGRALQAVYGGDVDDGPAGLVRAA
jgi:hypothetical protein